MGYYFVVSFLSAKVQLLFHINRENLYNLGYKRTSLPKTSYFCPLCMMTNLPFSIIL